MNSDIDKLYDILQNGDLIKENDVKVICARVREILVEEANV